MNVVRLHAFRTETRLKQPLLETVRCTVRPAVPSDLDALVAAVRSPVFPQRLPLAQMQTADEFRRWLELMCSRSADGLAFIWSIDLRGGPCCIGQVSLSPRTDSTAWSIAFWLDPTHWGNGLAVEAVSRVIKFTFESLAIQELWAGVALWNHRSIATLERLGFRYSGNNAAGYTVSGVAEPVQEFHLTLEQWQSRQCNA